MEVSFCSIYCSNTNTIHHHFENHLQTDSNYRLIIGSLWYCDNISQTDYSYLTVPHSINYSSERVSDLCLPSHTVWCVRCDVAYSVERSVLCKLVCQLLFPGLLPCGTLTELQMIYQKLYVWLRVPLSCSGALQISTAKLWSFYECQWYDFPWGRLHTNLPRMCGLKLKGIGSFFSLEGGKRCRPIWAWF